jgi:hypothetical protein
MVGVSMALTIALCIVSFVWIYAQVEPLTKDFVDAATVAPTKTSQPNESAQPAEEATSTPESDGGDSGAQTQSQSAPTQQPEPTPTTTEFRATHRVSSEVAINLRPGPAVSSGDPVDSLQPGTELQYLNETQDSQDPNADGDLRWMKFRTKDGLEGWIRQIDVEPINAGQ